MTNIHEALKSIELAEETGNIQYLLDALNKCKAALSEIDKCEPVLKVHHGEICYKSQADDQSYGMWCPVNFDTDHTFKEGAEFYTSPQPIEKCEPVGEVEPIGYMSNLAIQRLSQRGLGAITLHKTKTCFNPVYYTSPQPKEWVGLSDSEKVNIYNSIGEGYTLNFNDLCNDIEAKLKQLNTKG